MHVDSPLLCDGDCVDCQCLAWQMPLLLIAVVSDPELIWLDPTLLEAKEVEHKRFNRAPLSYAQRKDCIKQKKAAFLRRLDAETE